MLKLASDKNVGHGRESAARDAVFVVATDRTGDFGEFVAKIIALGKYCAGGIFPLVLLEASSERRELARLPAGGESSPASASIGENESVGCPGVGGAHMTRIRRVGGNMPVGFNRTHVEVLVDWSSGVGVVFSQGFVGVAVENDRPILRGPRHAAAQRTALYHLHRVQVTVCKQKLQGLARGEAQPLAGAAGAASSPSARTSACRGSGSMSRFEVKSGLF